MKNEMRYKYFLYDYTHDLGLNPDEIIKEERKLDETNEELVGFISLLTAIHKAQKFCWDTVITVTY